MTSRVLIGAQSFMDDFKKRASEAKESVYVQAMTFEGDAAGEQLIDILLKSPAKEKKLLVDNYSNAVINDSFIISPKYVKDKDFRLEISNTKFILEKARKNGIDVMFTNPLGFMMLRYPLRNHKKMVVVDGSTSYLGGINFSDHNFEWHDMMIAIENEDVGKSISRDFNKTWKGENQSLSEEFQDSTIYFFNGVKSADLYESLFRVIKSAKQTVEVISPYVSNPLLSVLEGASNNGVNVSIISPEKNNKGIFKNILLSELDKGYFKMFEYPGMSHLKAILIDGETLLFGSSNYDIVSYYWEQEIVLESRDQSLVAMFKTEILDPAKEKAIEINSGPTSWNASAGIMKALEVFCRITSRTVLRPH
ncbi:MAG: phosphatidylserine/phosphatidylglycerophosphate/cardiolipin synthase family protein [Cyclobacteriaceae bacterium]